MSTGFLFFVGVAGCRASPEHLNGQKPFFKEQKTLLLVEWVHNTCKRLSDCWLLLCTKDNQPISLTTDIFRNKKTHCKLQHLQTRLNKLKSVPISDYFSSWLGFSINRWRGLQFWLWYLILRPLSPFLLKGKRILQAPLPKAMSQDHQFTSILSMDQKICMILLSR